MQKSFYSWRCTFCCTSNAVLLAFSPITFRPDALIFSINYYGTSICLSLMHWPIFTWATFGGKWPFPTLSKKWTLDGHISGHFRKVMKSNFNFSKLLFYYVWFLFLSDFTPTKFYIFYSKKYRLSWQLNRTMFLLCETKYPPFYSKYTLKPDLHKR